MNVTTIGDLAQSLLNRSAQSRINSELSTLAQELTSGLKTDRGLTATADVAGYAALERTLTLSDSFLAVAREAALRTSGQQASIDNIAGQIDLVLDDVMKGQQALGSGSRSAMISNATSAFQTTISALNTSMGGRYLFSGVEDAQPPLRDAESILSDIRTLVAAAPDADAAVTAIDQYFDPGGDFDTNDYLGGAPQVTSVEIAPGERIQPNVTADEDAFRETLKTIAKVALLDDIAPPPDTTRATEVVTDAATALLNADAALIDQRAAIGTTQARIDNAIAQTMSERATLEQARIDMIGADPYETATRLEQTQLQLEQLYTVTARLSRLSLVNYL